MSRLEKQVMVVDDEPDILTIIKRNLESKGYQIHGFTDPVEALTHSKDCEICGILVTDIRIPFMNGFQLIRELKKIRPEIKVVVMTAFEITQKEWQYALPNTKVDQFLTKPFSSARLVQAIENCVPLVRSSALEV